MADLIQFRQLLHKYPELAHSETNTFAELKKRFIPWNPDKILDFKEGGKGFLFRGAEKGPVSVFRAELDALPIEEINKLEYSSVNPGISHVCGHDGHMAILTGLGELIGKNRPRTGDTLLLFQSGEETGTGARIVANSTVFKKLNADYIFALHNIPGLPLHTIASRAGVFSAASIGMVIDLSGKTSHAAEPENGINPDRAIAGIIELVHSLNKEKEDQKEISFATIIKIDLGEEAFGTSPGSARVLITLRSTKHNGITELKDNLESGIKSICKDQNLLLEINCKEDFPPVVNTRAGLDLVRQAAIDNSLPYREIDEAFRWSEDFGFFTQKTDACFFGLGAGVDQPALHNPDYDFPDQIINTGVQILFSIYKSLHKIN